MFLRMNFQKKKNNIKIFKYINIHIIHTEYIERTYVIILKLTKANLYFIYLEYNSLTPFEGYIMCNKALQCKQN